MTAATSKIEHFVIIVNSWKPLTIIIKSSILDVAAVLDRPLPLFLKDRTQGLIENPVKHLSAFIAFSHSLIFAKHSI